MDKEKIDKFWQSRTQIKNPRIATNYREDGRINWDIEFVKKHLPQKAKILDLGAGTCTLSTQLLDSATSITAVEKFSGFLINVPDHPRLKKICSDILNYTSNEKFDVILLFGVVNFLTHEEEQKVYTQCFNMLTPQGVFLVKNQCGLEEEVIVDSYSKELNSSYHARYPWVICQKKYLTQVFNSSEVVNIYPKELNRWPNTHFFGFVCKKP